MSAARERDVLLLEEGKVRVVQESMVQCQQLTDTMLAILEQFDRKLRALELSMQPLHRGTVTLINAHKSQQQHTTHTHSPTATQPTRHNTTQRTRADMGETPHCRPSSHRVRLCCCVRTCGVCVVLRCCVGGRHRVDTE